MEDGDLKTSGPAAQKQKRRSVSSQTAKRTQQEMLLAKARGELVLRELVEKQAAYLLVVLRQEIMAVPGAWAEKLVGLKTREEAAAVLREVTHAWLEQIADLPARIADERWLERLAETEAQGDGGGV